MCQCLRSHLYAIQKGKSFENKGPMCQPQDTAKVFLNGKIHKEQLQTQKTAQGHKIETIIKPQTGSQLNKDRI